MLQDLEQSLVLCHSIVILILAIALIVICLGVSYFNRDEKPERKNLRAAAHPSAQSPGAPRSKSGASPAWNSLTRAQQVDSLMEGLIPDSLSAPTHLTSQEKALLAKGHRFEMAAGGTSHSGHKILQLKVGTDNKPMEAVCFFFGAEDIAPAVSEGKSMAAFRYARSQAEQFLFAEGWDKYHDRFFTRFYVQEGLGAYDETVRAESPTPR